MGDDASPRDKAPTRDEATVPGDAAETETVERQWPDGTLRVRKEVLRNPDGTTVNHGLYTQWHNNGRKAYEAVFIRGKIHGVETHWHKNGGKWTEQHYDHGQRHGARITWDQDGRKRREQFFVENKPDGTWTIWDEEGKIKWQGRFDRGVPLPR